jgi:predicted nucleotidyltransferase
MGPTAGLPPPASIVAGLRTLVLELGIPVVAGLVYGSVARGAHRLASDVDALLVTAHVPAAPARLTAVSAFKDWVAELGLQPDDDHPVELFAEHDCRRILGISDCDRRIPTEAACTPEDAWELLYALATPHLLVTGGPLVGELKSAARRRLEVLAVGWGNPCPLDLPNPTRC